MLHVVQNSPKKRKRASVDLVSHLVNEGDEPYGQTDSIHWTEVSATGFIPERHSVKDSRDVYSTETSYDFCVSN